MLCEMVHSQSYAADLESPPPMVSLTIENEHLTDVLGKISKATGYEIAFDTEWGDVPVSVHLNNERLDNALGRVLGNLNHAVIWNEPERKVSIFIYGYAGSKTGGSSPAGRSGDRGAGEYRMTPSRPPSVNRARQRTSRDEDADIDVSISGRKTRFEQATKTTLD